MKQFQIYLGISNLIFNSISLLTGFVYFFKPSNAHIWNVNGIFVFFTLLSSCILLLYYGKIFNQDLSSTRNFCIASYIYYFTLGITYIILFVINFNGYTPDKGTNIVFTIVLVISYSWVFLFPIVLIGKLLLQKRKEKDKIEVQKEKTNSSQIWKRILKTIIMSYALITLGFGIPVAITLLASGFHSMFFFFLGVFVGPAGVFLGLGFLNSTSILIHSLKKSARWFRYKVIAIATLGSIFISISFIPLFSTPVFINQAEREFSNSFNPHFGGDWKDKIEESGYKDHFLKNPFQLTGYFLGLGKPNCKITTDILYFDGNHGHKYRQLSIKTK